MYMFFKRFFDIIASLFGIVILSLPLLVLVCAVKLSSPGPAFFRQKRVGRGKKLFTMLKFRTMRTDAPSDTPTHLLQDPYAHITPVGRFLRRTSLDELPQLFNILHGDMSLIGPRPALWNQDDLIAARDECGANGIRPGLTGLAQVMGRDELPIPVKAGYDGEYVEKMGLLLDLRILFRTAFSVAKADGVKEGGHKQDGE
jgi:O-antigen biosynthesis protein WbqP